MELKEKINNEIKSAMKERRKDDLEALRSVKSAILLAETEKGAEGALKEDAEVKLLQRLVKQRRESAELFKAQGRNDLADPELFQAEIIAKFLPEQMSEADVEAAVVKVISDVGATGPQDMGKVMGKVMGMLSGKADGKLISSLVKKNLS